MIDKGLLIREVYKRRALWQRNHLNHSNRAVRDKLWDEVASKLGCSRETAQKKWKNLKDNFRREVKKEKETQATGGTYVYRSAWPYFRHLVFMKGEIETRTVTDPFTEDFGFDPQVETIKVEVSDNDDGQSGDGPEPMHAIPEVTLEEAPTPTTQRPVVVQLSGVSSGREDLVISSVCSQKDLERNQRQQRSGAAAERDLKTSDDYHFFMSLIPHIRNFGSIQKLRLRQKIQQIVLDEACKNHISE